MKPLRIAALCVVVILELWMAVLIWPAIMRGLVDFRAYYGAGYLVLHHQPLYDYSSEMATQGKLFGDVGGSPFIHPAYEALLFAPLAILPPKAAYFVFLVMNIAILVWLWRSLKIPAEMLVFASIPLTVLWGQDSILLLAAVGAAYLALQKERYELAGVCLGLGLFRFQIILPIIVLFALWKQVRVLYGFVLTATVLVAISSLVSKPLTYIRVLLTLSTHPMYGYRQMPERMVNLRNLLPSNPLVIVATVGVLVLVYFAGRHQEITSKLDFALLAAVLVGYHVYMHDLSTLAIPLRFHRHGRIAMICVSALTLLNDPVFFRLTGLSVLILLLIRIKPRVCMGMNSTKNFSTG